MHQKETIRCENTMKPHIIGTSALMSVSTERTQAIAQIFWSETRKPDSEKGTYVRRRITQFFGKNHRLQDDPVAEPLSHALPCRRASVQSVNAASWG